MLSELVTDGVGGGLAVERTTGDAAGHWRAQVTGSEIRCGSRWGWDGSEGMGATGRRTRVTGSERKVPLPDIKIGGCWTGG